jgi:hypothetical protein
MNYPWRLHIAVRKDDLSAAQQLAVKLTGCADDADGFTVPITDGADAWLGADMVLTERQRETLVAELETCGFDPRWALVDAASDTLVASSEEGEYGTPWAFGASLENWGLKMEPQG